MVMEIVDIIIVGMPMVRTLFCLLTHGSFEAAFTAMVYLQDYLLSVGTLVLPMATAASV
jgi:hypothetical protein